MNRILLNALLACAGAFVVWLVAEPIPWLTTDTTPGGYVNWVSQLVLGAMVGAGIGVGIGAADGLYAGSRQRLLRGCAVGGGVGVAGGLVGIHVGQMVFGPLYAFGEQLERVQAALAFAVQTGARSVGWALMGLLIGGTLGLAYGSGQKARNGFVGGLVGGGIGGFLFQVLWWVLRVPEFSRAVGFSLVGGAVGLGIATAEEVLKQAWVRVLVGRNEGREFILSKDVVVIGRDELADIGLFGDRSVGLKHAVVRRTPGGYVLQDAGNSIGTKVNGTPVRERVLRDGDVIEIGSFRLEFHEKAGRAPAPEPVDAVRRFPVAPETPGVCPYCGSRKDPVTGACACSVETPPAVGPTASAQPEAARFRLVGTSGPSAGMSIVVEKSVTSVGREPGRDLVLPDPTVSRRHATLRQEAGRIQVVDEGSSNGTFVNGQRVSSAYAGPGDEIRFGSSTFRVELA
ncbi:MAG: FHA domain-containing protein [Armatimonadota bacterium]